MNTVSEIFQTYLTKKCAVSDVFIHFFSIKLYEMCNSTFSKSTYCWVSRIRNFVNWINNIQFQFRSFILVAWLVQFFFLYSGDSFLCRKKYLKANKVIEQQSYTITSHIGPYIPRRRLSKTWVFLQVWSLLYF